MLVNFLFGRYSPVKDYIKFNAQRDPKYLVALKLLCQLTHEVHAAWMTEQLFVWEAQRNEAARNLRYVVWAIKRWGKPVRIAMTQWCSSFSVKRRDSSTTTMMMPKLEMGRELFMRAMPLTWGTCTATIYIPVKINALTWQTAVVYGNYRNVHFNENGQFPSRWHVLGALREIPTMGGIQIDYRASPSMCSNIIFPAKRRNQYVSGTRPFIDGTIVGWDAHWYGQQIVVE